jgi:hypothetical protein
MVRRLGVFVAATMVATLCVGAALVRPGSAQPARDRALERVKEPGNSPKADAPNRQVARVREAIPEPLSGASAVPTNAATPEWFLKTDPASRAAAAAANDRPVDSSVERFVKDPLAAIGDNPPEPPGRERRRSNAGRAHENRGWGSRRARRGGGCPNESCEALGATTCDHRPRAGRPDSSASARSRTCG